VNADGVNPAELRMLETASKLASERFANRKSASRPTSIVS
jgi:hypothetical protein